MGSTKKFINRFEACKVEFEQEALDEIGIESFIHPHEDAIKELK